MESVFSDGRQRGLNVFHGADDEGKPSGAANLTDDRILQPGQPLYEFIYAAAIIFFCFFYTSLVFNPREISENLKKSGAYIDGIRPGEATAKHIDKVMARLTFIGSMYMVFVCLVPQFMMSFFNVQFYFGGTSLLIVVVVVMDFAAQLATYKMQNQYGSILQKAHLGNYGR